jgi:hypothetical protein
MSGTGTFIIVCYTGLGLGLVVLLHYLIRRWRWRWIVSTPLLLGLAALAVAPYLEEAHITAQFEELCKRSGIHVLRQVRAEGYFDDFGMRSLTPGPITNPEAIRERERRGYQFVEYRGFPDRSGKPFYRIEKSANGWIVRRIEHPTARYRYFESAGNQLVEHKVWLQEQVILDTESHEVISRKTRYKRILNTVDQAWMGLFGSTLRICPDPSKGPPQGLLVDQTIVPERK